MNHDAEDSKNHYAPPPPTTVVRKEKAIQNFHPFNGLNVEQARHELLEDLSLIKQRLLRYKQYKEQGGRSKQPDIQASSNYALQTSRLAATKDMLRASVSKIYCAPHLSSEGWVRKIPAFLENVSHKCGLDFQAFEDTMFIAGKTFFLEVEYSVAQNKVISLKATHGTEEHEERLLLEALNMSDFQAATHYIEKELEVSKYCETADLREVFLAGKALGEALNAASPQPLSPFAPEDDHVCSAQYGVFSNTVLGSKLAFFRSPRTRYEGYLHVEKVVSAPPGVHLPLSFTPDNSNLVCSSAPLVALLTLKPPVVACLPLVDELLRALGQDPTRPSKHADKSETSYLRHLMQGDLPRNSLVESVRVSVIEGESSPRCCVLSAFPLQSLAQLSAVLQILRLQLVFSELVLSCVSAQRPTSSREPPALTLEVCPLPPYLISIIATKPGVATLVSATLTLSADDGFGLSVESTGAQRMPLGPSAISLVLSHLRQHLSIPRLMEEVFAQILVGAPHDEQQMREEDASSSSASLIPAHGGDQTEERKRKRAD